MGKPQIAVIVLYALELGISLAKHGQKKEGNYSFFMSAIAIAILMGLLCWGGFFR